MNIADLKNQSEISSTDSNSVPEKRIRMSMPEGFELPRFISSKDLLGYFDVVMRVMRKLAARNAKVLTNMRVPLVWKSPVDQVERVFYRHTIEIEYDAIQCTPYKRRRWQTAAQAYRVQKRINKRAPVERVRATLSLSKKQALLLSQALKERK